MWKSYETEFQGILQNLERHKDLVERRASVDQYRRYREDMIIIKTRLDEQISAERLKKLVTIREWLAVGQQPVDDHAEYQRIRRQYTTTAQWILDHAVIKEWINDTSPSNPCTSLFWTVEDSLLIPVIVVWMHGIPGAGTSLHFFP